MSICVKGSGSVPKTLRVLSVFIYRKSSVVCSQTTELGFGGFFNIFFLERILMCVWGVMSSEEHPNKAESEGGGQASLGWFPWGPMLDPDRFGRLNQKECSRCCENV